jgi:lipopolysaccharide/colanic/teichoic acid biosynthesis glycosyltransferase
MRYRRVKRLLDVPIASVFGLLLLPVAAAVLVVMAVDMLLVPRDRGGFLHRERRISGGREFELLKFRTLRAAVLRAMPSGGYVRQFEHEASNLTWAGRHVLKPWYLDELPQLLNILIGSMSLVGPRPWPRAEVAQQSAEGFDYRNQIVAGWTGPAQVQKGGSATGPWPDLHYVEACQSWGPLRLLRYDLCIIVATLSVLARRGGLND